MRFLALLLSLLLLFALAPPAHAQEVGERRPDSEDLPATWNPALSPAAASQIILYLNRSDDTCGKLLWQYRVDCLRIVYEDLAEQLPRGSDFDPVRSALQTAAARLDRLVSQNLDPTAPPQALSVGGKPLARRLPSARAVSAASRDQVTAAATTIVEEAATVLLRSAEASRQRQLQYQEIASALDTTKVLLRSG